MIKIPFQYLRIANEPEDLRDRSREDGSRHGDAEEAQEPPRADPRAEESEQSQGENGGQGAGKLCKLSILVLVIIIIAKKLLCKLPKYKVIDA